MIRHILDPNELDALPEKGMEAGKIRALLNAYGTHFDFCRIYRQENTFISALDGSCVVCSAEDTDIDELAEFFRMNGFAEIFCDVPLGALLADKLSATVSEINVMKFAGSADISVDYNTTSPLTEVYSIISEGFDIQFEPWYLDMSHRVRHGVSVCCTLDDKAALVIQHSINGEALISQVVCRTEFRGQGITSKLVKTVCNSLAPSEVFVLCEDALVPFYEKCGFVSAGKNTVIKQD